MWREKVAAAVVDFVVEIDQGIRKGKVLRHAHCSEGCPSSEECGERTSFRWLLLLLTCVLVEKDQARDRKRKSPPTRTLFGRLPFVGGMRRENVLSMAAAVVDVRSF
jgi:hypothetical protein